MKKIFIILFIGIFLISFVSAEKTYTTSTETTCENGICNKVLYSGINFVEEDGQWKKIADAKSLKDKGDLK